MNDLNNTVIKVLTEEHGKKVIKWWKNQGVNTGSYSGCLNEKNNSKYIYYGLINNVFRNYPLEEVKLANAKIIKLPQSTGLIVYPFEKEVWVADIKEVLENNPEKRIAFGEKNGYILCWCNAESFESAKEKNEITFWKYWKDVSNEEVVELTLQDISDGKGVGVPAHLIRIK